MRKIIRESVFESNSSSSHSLIIKSRKDIRLETFPRNSEYIIWLNEYGVTDGYEQSVDVARLHSEVDKAKFMLNVITEHIETDEYDENCRYPEIAYWIDYDNRIRNDNRNFKTLISQKPFVWFKEMLEEVTGTEFEYEEPDNDYFPYYKRIYLDNYAVEDVFNCNWYDEKDFKEYMKDIVFNEDIIIVDADIPYGCMNEEDL